MSRLSDTVSELYAQARRHPREAGILGGAFLVLLLLWMVWPTQDQPPVIAAAVEEQPFKQSLPSPGRRWKPGVRAQFQSVQDRLDVSGSSPNFVLSIQMESAGSGRLSLQSQDGQDLRELFAGPLKAGTWAFRWDGTGDDTLPVAPGRYQIRWQRGDQSVVQSVQILGS
jgi:hypothetical protein